MLCLAFLAETTGAADLAVFAAGRMPPAAFPPAAVIRQIPPGSEPRRRSDPLRLSEKAAPKEPTLGQRWAAWTQSIKEDIHILVAWADARLREFEGQNPRRGETALFIARQDEVVAKAASSPVPAAADRMLVARDPEFAGVADALSEVEAELARTLGARAYGRAIMRPRHAEPAVEGGGVRLRVTYLDSYGLTWGDAQGLHARIPGKNPLDIRARVPAAYRREFALYFCGDTARYEVEIENTGPEAIENVTVYAQQEAFNPRGGVGPTIAGSRLASLPVGRLAAGERKVLTHSFVLGRAATSALISFEQTHLSVRAEKDGKDALLLDAPQAGIVDPPAN